MAVLFGLLLPLLRGHGLPKIPWLIAIMLWFWAVIAPVTLQPVYKVWMRIGLVLGWINTRIILGVVFYILMVPMGLMMRLFSGDPMRRKLEVDLETYRLPCKKRMRKSMEKPY